MTSSSFDRAKTKPDSVNTLALLKQVSKNAAVLDNKKETANDAGVERIIAVQNNIDTKAKFTQTCKFWNEEKLKNVYTEEKDNASRSTPSLFYDEHKKCMSFVEEPAPQWLIEEALSRGNELRVAISTSKKLKRELSKTRKELKSKSNDYESVNKCFTILKQEMETTETNLNDLINENATLRKKFEDMKEWMELKIGKEQNERISVTQMRELPKYRELANLKKKSEEDCATIKQLHNKLLRSESANANKGFLLNSYKGQISDLAKEKDLFTSKIKELENELTALRTSNAQLKAKISLINEEKLNLACKMEKSETDLKQQIESQINRKHEESMQEEINAIKMKCEDAIKVLKEKLITFENKNIEYSKAIKEFLKKIHDHCDERNSEKTNFYGSEESEREAHETACNILNMTPEELTNFMNGKPNTVNNTWLTDLNKITSKNNFSDGLAKFLFKTTLDKIYTSA
ncbi:hypothetical protein HZH66_006486 [Vespula vulgaris]|uniref:Uncharacterized protein n=1 Tax=Vespula vulgaris TaxID=7454 RepID=A0A834K1D3_VESVU|nr:hypothetical protein HZH66_006486 [Vespula vulgaris]